MHELHIVLSSTILIIRCADERLPGRSASHGRYEYNSASRLRYCRKRAVSLSRICSASSRPQKSLPLPTRTAKKQ